MPSWIRKTCSGLWWVLCKVPIWITSLLDWTVGVAERLVVLAIAFVAFYVGFQTLRGTSEKPLLEALSANWKGLLLLLVPLFYRTVRGFMERVEEAWGMKTRSSTKQTDPTKQEGE